MRIFVTGGAGFIGTSLVKKAVKRGHKVINLDCLTYAANIENHSDLVGNPNYAHEQISICDKESLTKVFEKHCPDSVMNLAAESHVDRSIDSPDKFIEANLVGTFTLLEVFRKYWQTREHSNKMRFLHISTDEVFGSLGVDGKFTEVSRYEPKSPYAASKAGSDHLVRAWANTFGIPTLITNCSNNYGPYQFPEKLIPLTILKALGDESLPVYGDGSNVRDWLFVSDHVEALLKVLVQGEVNESYNIGGNNELSNLEVVERICRLMDKRIPKRTSHLRLIEFVEDRPGHDKRYAIDSTKIKEKLGWSPSVSFDDGLEETLDWYLQNKSWWERLRSRGSDKRRGLNRTKQSESD
ncbi:MAG: dTDP-glucose 4,6-dehydratase [Legionellales bacterium]|nr:dTDP-glucose 4,6-dehydratase [Legionellales bacterium]